MKKKLDGLEQSDINTRLKQELRQTAEDLSRVSENLATKTLEVMSLEEIRQLIHELDVHKIELEIQNEELRRAQTELNSVSIRYFNLYNLAPIGYCTISEDGQIQEVNLTLSTLLGVNRSTLNGEEISSFIYSDDQDIYYHHKKRLFDTGTSQDCELRMVKKDGTLFWAHLVGNAALEEGAKVCRVAIQDVTEQINANNLLRASEEKYRLITENVADVITVFNTDKDKYTYISPSIFQLRKLTAEEAMKEDKYASLTPESLASEKEDTVRDLHEFIKDPENPKNYISEVQEYTKDGDVVWVELSKKFRFNADGEIEIISISRNITDRIIAFADAYEAMIWDARYKGH